MINKFLTEVKSWLDTPYLHQAGVKGIGCDCVNLPYQAYKKVSGKRLPELGPYSPDWHIFREEQKMLNFIYDTFSDYVDIVTDSYRAGDILLIALDRKMVCHVAIYLGENEVIEAMSDLRKVVQHPLRDNLKKRIHSALRFKEFAL